MPRTPARDDRANGEGEEHNAAQIRELILASGKYPTEDEVQDMIEQHKSGKPLAYITGTHRFGSLSLVIDPPVYIPRVETEQYVLVLAQRILSFDPSPQNAIRVLDICSGSGCIPLLLAKEGGGRIKTVGLEVDDRALSVARKNAERNGVAHLSTFEKFDLFEDDVEALRDRLGTFDVVISNPPYVSSEDMRKVASTWWEGRYALQGKLRGSSNGGGEGEGGDGLGDDDGLSFYRRIREVYALFLSRSRPRSLPKLVLEVGATQSPPVKEMYAAEGRLEVQKETPRRKELGAPQLEQGDVVGTERSVWIYESEP